MKKLLFSLFTVIFSISLFGDITITDKGESNHYPLLLRGKLFAHSKADGHKADVHRRQEDDKTHIGVGRPHEDLNDLEARQLQV